MNGTGRLSCLVIVVAFNVGLWKLRFTKTGETIVFNAGRISRILGFELLTPLIWAKGHCNMRNTSTDLFTGSQTASMGGAGTTLNCSLPQ